MMTVLLQKLFFIFAGLIVLFPLSVFGGNPIAVDENGKPLRWEGPIVMTLDPGSLGTLNNANATAMIQDTISRFTAVPHMALPLITFSDPFPTDITSANLSDLWKDGNWIIGNGITPVIFDSDGSIIHEIFCAPNDPCERFVAGVGGIKARAGASILEGFIILGLRVFEWVK